MRERGLQGSQTPLLVYESMTVKTQYVSDYDVLANPQRLSTKVGIYVIGSQATTATGIAYLHSPGTTRRACFVCCCLSVLSAPEYRGGNSHQK